jgi:hypothetical protein
MPCSFITSLAYPPHHTHTHTHYLNTLPEEEGSCPAVSSSDSKDEDELKSKKSWKPRREKTNLAGESTPTAMHKAS